MVKSTCGLQRSLSPETLQICACVLKHMCNSRFLHTSVQETHVQSSGMSECCEIGDIYDMCIYKLRCDQNFCTTRTCTSFKLEADGPGLPEERFLPVPLAKHSCVPCSGYPVVLIRSFVKATKKVSVDAGGSRWGQAGQLSTCWHLLQTKTSKMYEDCQTKPVTLTH